MKQYTIELSDGITASLCSIAHRNDISVAEAMRRAFALLEVAHRLKDTDRIGLFENVGGGKLRLVREVKVF